MIIKVKTIENIYEENIRLSKGEIFVDVPNDSNVDAVLQAVGIKWDMQKAPLGIILNEKVLSLYSDGLKHRLKQGDVITILPVFFGG